MPSSTKLRRREDLRDYQEQMIRILRRPWHPNPAKRLPGVIMAWDMGAGKTVTFLTAMRELLDEFAIRKVLIVANVLVAETVWPIEIEEWEHLRVLKITLVRVTEDELEEKRKALYRKARARGLSPDAATKASQEESQAWKARRLARLANDDAEIHVINKEGLDFLWAHFREGKDWPYDVMALDDVRDAKSGKKRSRGTKDETRSKKASRLSRFGLIARARKHMDATVQLTGTPCANSLIHMWGLAYTIDGGERLGTARTAFEHRWFTQNRYSYKLTPTASAVREISERVSDIMFSLPPEAYPKLPPLISIPVHVKLPAKVLSAYREFERELYSKEYDVEAVSSGVLHGKLLQFANGSMYREKGEDIFIHDKKLEALERIVDETNGEPLLVAYSYEFDLARIQRKFRKAVVLKDTNALDTVKKWNAGKIQMLLAHPASAAHGLNLQFGGHQAVWYGLTSDLELYMQFNKRLSRPGQTKPTFLHHVISQGTIDEDILPLYLNAKKATQDEVLSYVRMELKGRTVR